MTVLNKTYQGSVYNVIPCADGTLLLEDRGDISAGDGWKTANIPGLAEVRTAQTVAMLGYLNASGIPVAYIEPVNATSIRQQHAHMLLGEFVLRRHLIGSYQQRYPHIPQQRSKELVCELFSKQSLDLRDRDHPNMVDGHALRLEFTAAAGGDKRAGWNLLEAHIKAKRILMDPLVQVRRGFWYVYDAHGFYIENQPLYILPAFIGSNLSNECWQIAQKAYVALEKGLARIDCDKVGLPNLKSLTLADIKFEFGVTANDQLVLADVVNLDSLRLLKNGGYAKEDHLSKQVFRDDLVDDAAVLKAYEYGLAAVSQLKV